METDSFFLLNVVGHILWSTLVAYGWVIILESITIIIGFGVFLNQILSNSLWAILIFCFLVAIVWEVVVVLLRWSVFCSHLLRFLHLSFQILFLKFSTMRLLSLMASFSLFSTSLLLKIQALGINPVTRCWILKIMEFSIFLVYVVSASLRLFNTSAVFNVVEI